MKSVARNLKLKAFGLLAVSIFVAGIAVSQSSPDQEEESNQQAASSLVIFVELEEPAAEQALEAHKTGLESFDSLLAKHDASAGLWFSPNTSLKQHQLEALGYYRYLKVEAKDSAILDDLRSSIRVRHVEAPSDEWLKSADLQHVIPVHALGEVIVRFKEGIIPELFLSENERLKNQFTIIDISPTYKPLSLPTHLSPDLLKRRKKLNELNKDRNREFIIRVSKTADVNILVQQLRNNPKIEIANVNGIGFRN